MRRDRITFAMMLGVPLMQLVLFGFAINNDPKGLPAALVATSNDRFTRAMVSALQMTGYYRFDHVVASSAAEAERLMAKRRRAFVVTIPSDFARRVERGDNPQMLIEADATDPSVASGAISTLATVASQALLREQGMQAAAAESGAQPAASRGAPPLQSGRHLAIQHRARPARRHPADDDGDDDLDGADARDRARHDGEPAGHAGQPGSRSCSARSCPISVVGAVQVVVVLTAAKLLFSVPFVGSLPLLLSAMLAFVLSLVLLGYTISTVARTQMQAMQLTFFFFLPSLLLSGFMFPYRGMPDWAQALGEIFPLTHFLRIIRAVMLKGAELPAVASRNRLAGRVRGFVCRRGAGAVQADAGLAPQRRRRRHPGAERTRSGAGPQDDEGETFG